MNPETLMKLPIEKQEHIITNLIQKTLLRAAISAGPTAWHNAQDIDVKVKVPKEFVAKIAELSIRINTLIKEDNPEQLIEAFLSAMLNYLIAEGLIYHAHKELFKRKDKIKCPTQTV